MATIRAILGIFCLAFLGGTIEPHGDILGSCGLNVDSCRSGISSIEPFNSCRRYPFWTTQSLMSRSLPKSGKYKGFNFGAWSYNSQLTTHNSIATHNSIIKIARSQLNVREATGQNDGREVEAYLNYTGNKKGEPWCASFVSWVFGQVGQNAPRTAWSPDLFPPAKLVKKPSLAVVFGIYYANLKRIAHCGIVAQQQGDWVGTIEGNTDVEGGREGQGVYHKWRHQRTIKAYANRLDTDRNGGEP